MTIGIGFKCTDGIVIAADTQYTKGAYKGHGPKVFPLFTPVERPDLAVVIAGAGGVAFMRRAVEKIETALEKCVAPSLKDVQQTVEAELLDFYETHIYPMPQKRQEASGFELILGIWTKNDGFGLLKTADTTVSPVVSHGSASCTVGMGEYVTDYALALTYRPGMNVADAKFIAALCVKAAKEHVDYCGGKTHIYTITASPPYHIHRILPVEVNDAEQYSEDLFSTIKHILDYLDPESLPDDASVDNAVGVLRQSVIDFRDSQRQRRERLRIAKEKLNAQRRAR